MAETSPEIWFEDDPDLAALLEKYQRAAVPREKFAAGIILFDRADAKGHKVRSAALLDELEKNAYTDQQRNIILIKRGENLLRQSRFEEAVVYLEKAIVGLSQTPDSLDLFHTYRNLAWIYFRQGYLERARSFTDGAGLVLEMRDGQTDRETASARASLYHILGLIDSTVGEHDRAIGYYDKEIGLLEELGEGSRTGSVYNNLSGIYKARGMFAQALEYQLKSFNMAERSGELLSVAISCNNLGEIYYALGKYRPAREFYGRYLEINKKINNLVGDAFGHAGLGRICQSTGDHQQAEKEFAVALKVAGEVKGRGKEASILAEMAELYLAWGQPEKAVPCLDKAIQISLEIERFNTHRHQVLNAKVIISRALAEGPDLSLLGKARVLLADVLSRTMIVEDEEAVSAIELEIDAWYNLAKTDHHLGDTARAKENIAKAIEKTDSITGQLEPELKESFLARKDINEVYELKKQLDNG
ncbi:MAG: tetratricopeptide repeat protein [Candidatus Edwardsbacteria bacterium]|nr:tetratricopeptide repeat protein [Candidatus Edwardsbacteria bacterium]